MKGIYEPSLRLSGRLCVTGSRLIPLTPTIKVTWDASQGWSHGLCPSTWEGALTSLAFDFLHVCMSAQQGLLPAFLHQPKEKSWGLQVFSFGSQAGTALGISALMPALEQDSNPGTAESNQVSLQCKAVWDRAHSFTVSRWQCPGERLTGQQRLVPVLLLSYSTRLLGVSQPSSSALQAAWHQAGLSGGTILLSHRQHCARTPPLTPKGT